MIQHTVGQSRRTALQSDYLQNIYIASCLADRALRHGSHSFTCKLHHTCLLFISVHQMAPPLTEVADIRLQLTIDPEGMKG